MSTAEFFSAKDVNVITLRDAQAAALAQIESNAASFGMRFPDDTTQDQIYQLRRVPGYWSGSNVGWTTGFWPGMGWLAYEISGRYPFQQWAQSHYSSFAQRLALRIDLGYHDLGFIYGPGAVAAWRVTGESRYRALALEAAAILRARFLPQAGVIQAWGSLDDSKEQGRIIVDTVMNLPLLHWASAQSGDRRFTDAAFAHLEKTRHLLIRPDGSTAHSCHVNPATGEAVRVSTVQGHAHDSCWARGQAWAIYGMALNHRYAPGLGLLESAAHMAEYLLAHMPDDGICQWDLALDWRDGVQRDSSASAIAVCGLLELAAQLPAGVQRERFEQAALLMLRNLAGACAAPVGRGHGLLSHGVYSLPENRGVDEANLWGDYYYLEALARVNTGWSSFWHTAA
jgi:unsaturated chondroitin disaccharide hydrolase